MTAYAEGYRTGWISYLEEYPCPKNSLRILVVQADAVAEHASHGLLPQEDYWLGYHHGRVAAEACVALYLHTSNTSERNSVPSLTNRSDETLGLSC